MARRPKATPAAKPAAGNETAQKMPAAIQTPPEVSSSPSPVVPAPSDPPPLDGANPIPLPPPPDPAPPVTSAGGRDDRAKAGPSLIVTGPKQGRWRAGRKFGPEPVTLIVADLDEGEFEALEKDPALTVLHVDAPY